MRLLLFYTDPGSGVMLLQVLLAFLAGGLFYFRNFFRRLFGRRVPAQAEMTSSPSEDSKDAETGV